MTAEETTTTTTTTTFETKVEPTAQPGPAPAPNTVVETLGMQDIAQWRGKLLIDRDGEKIGKLEEVYVDVETDEPMFGTVKEGHFGRHLTFVPLAGLQFGPDDLQVRVTKEQVRAAPNIEMHDEELSEAGESALYHHYELNYAAPETGSGRRLARR